MTPSPIEGLRRTLVTRAGALRHLPALFRLAWATSPALTLGSVGLRLVRAALPTLMLYVAKLVIDTVVAGRADPAAAAAVDGLGDPRLRHVAWLIGIEFALAVASDLLGRATSLVDGVLSERTGNAITLRLMAHAATLDLEQFEDPGVQDGLERARRQVAWRSNLIGQLLGQGQDLLTAISLAAAVVAFLPWLVVLLVLALIPAFLNELHFNRQSYRLAYRRSPERRESDYMRYLGAGAESAKEVKLFGLHTFLSDRFGVLANRILGENTRLAVRRAGFGGAFAGLGTLAYYLAYGVIAVRTLDGTLTVGDLTFLSGAFLRLRGLVEGLLLGVSQLTGQAQYLDDLFSFFAVAPRIRSPEQPAAFPDPIRDGFVFEDVGYRYPGAERWAVRHLSLTIRAGEVVALVGENGSGKTTIVKLLSRLYDPSEGRILLDGRDLRDYDLEVLRARIGVIFQDFVRFDFTAGDNIAVGRIDARADVGRIGGAASRALADLVVAKLPTGYDQRLGRRFEDGVDLSGGEWQKIAIARAYMRDAEVLILDEPTAALDARAEAEVFARFGDLAAGRTAILISHRFSTVRQANRIVVLAEGRVQEAGSHVELLRSGGRYAELFELQAAGYR
ncbi:ABC transporter ATP-binding protein [Methylobacterium haplocladii]|uniref:ABC transporter ATP-binding protein n=1 Tax=Methylobacterium haplocladii TaxID=1176176 RepID=A0A512IK89_9HYPH|nr:ABC transporter ATP-binding protein [Methylobacterium haplocladii]GEO98137.1 ABC transporter ATP-binding protein [Methylobacterium haplocladii]GJD83617.1 Lipid A export ATP-binding/permease protein MsbA [Methylobacterium haplocladii]GLS60344.1 ABC transporter ATP-binding protein [Methylobacterium haplocladii]